MKLRCKFIINKVSGENIAVPVGKDSEFKGYIKINNTGKDIFELLKKDTDREKIISALLKKYPDAKKEDISENVDDFLDKLHSAGLLI